MKLHFYYQVYAKDQRLSEIQLFELYKVKILYLLSQLKLCVYLENQGHSWSSDLPYDIELVTLRNLAFHIHMFYIYVRIL
jgi:hypothetical protein